jgi:hypothetical protein
VLLLLLAVLPWPTAITSCCWVSRPSDRLLLLLLLLLLALQCVCRF